jgi:glycosyltransferase involved in cell wall biosynthesis
MRKPLVSVSMITYNHAPFIAEAIEGVLRQQTNFPFELVIGEDCSMDETRRIVMGYQQAYPEVIRVVTSNTNVGMSKNCLRTQNACIGKYIAFCEGDDYWHHPLKLQKELDFLESHPECGMVHSSYDVLDAETGKSVKDYLNYRGFKVPSDPDITDIITGCRVSFRIQTCTVMLRRNLCVRIMDSDPYLYGDHFLMGDTQLWAEMALAAKIGFLPESLATYRLLPNSASRSRDRSKVFRFELSDCEMKLYLCDKHKLPASARMDRELAWCRVTLRQAFHERNAALANEARARQRNLSLKQWLLYLGAKYQLIHSGLRIAAFCRDVPNQLNKNHFV